MTNNIILIGPMGSGKTTIGKKLAKDLNKPFVDLDETIEKNLGVTISTIFDTEGEEGFRKRELKALKNVFIEHNNAVIATGGGCILTENCRRLISCQRLVIHLDIGVEQQYNRLYLDKKRPILQVGNLKEKLLILRENRHQIYSSLADLYIASDSISLRKIIIKIKLKIEGQS